MGQAIYVQNYHMIHWTFAQYIMSIKTLSVMNDFLGFRPPFCTSYRLNRVREILGQWTGEPRSDPLQKILRQKEPRERGR